MKNTVWTVIAALTIALSATTALAKHEHKQMSAQVVNIAVTSEGFVPASIQAKAGHTVRLVVTRKTDQTCAKDIVIKDFNISRPLPLNHAVEVTFTPTKAGQIRYACAMNMFAGVIVVE